MTGHRWAFWAGSAAVFFAVSFFLFIDPSSRTVLFPAFALVFLWTHYWKDPEVRVIVLFLVTLTGLYLLSFADALEERAVLAFELLGLWSLAFVLGMCEKRAEDETERHLVALDEASKEIDRRLTELKFYEGHHEGIHRQIDFRKGLSQAARALGSAGELEEVRSQLGRILEAAFPGAAVRIHSGVSRDALEEWVFKKKVPLLVQDVRQDERFRSLADSAPFRSALVAPLGAVRELAGFLRVESENPRQFAAEDLRTVDALSTMASLSMGNVRLFEQVRALAVTDGLTRLYTHRAFQAQLQEEILRASRGHAAVSLVMADIDYFKSYNDTRGHQAGDEALRAVSAVLRENSREIDFAARYGGEEFAVILPAVSKPQAAELAELLRRKVEQGGAVTISLGVACFPEDATTASQLIRSADERLYKAKQGGRNRVEA